MKHDMGNNILKEGAALLSGKRLEDTVAAMARLSGATDGLRKSDIGMGESLVPTRLYFMTTDSVQTVLDALKISPFGNVQVYSYDLGAAYEMPAEKMVSLFDDHLRRKRHDYMIKDSTDSWCILINHSGGVMYATSTKT
ncbi:MAG: hypothetical protein RL518_192 [Pseudomonadota bacterium]|jgi:hypothetical protein